MDISFDVDRVKGVCHVMYISSPTQREENYYSLYQSGFNPCIFIPYFVDCLLIYLRQDHFFNRNFKHLDALYETIFECTSLRYLPVML